MADTGIILLGRWLEGEGFTVAGHPRFLGPGGDDGSSGHSATGNHPKGRAIDVNRDGAPGGEQPHLRALYNTLEQVADQIGIVELYYEGRGIPNPAEDHDDHLHVAIAGPPTPALQQLVGSAKLEGTSVLEDVGSAAKGAGEAVLGVGADAAAVGAKALVSLLFEAIGEDGARILLYIVFVIGGAILAFAGLARMVGIGAGALPAGGEAVA